MHYTAHGKPIAEHVKLDHKQSSLTVYFKEIIYGGVDGIVTTFAVVAGFSGAAVLTDTTLQLSFMVVLLFGLANLFADGVSMGLGNFLSVRSEQGLYRKLRAEETWEITHHPEVEYNETIEILTNKGFSAADAKTIADIYQKNETYWLDFMMNHELEVPDSTGENPVYTGIATFASFVCFGVIPLLPFIVVQSGSPEYLFGLSSITACIALLLLGILKWRVTRVSALASIGEVMIVGITAGLVAFFVGTFFA